MADKKATIVIKKKITGGGHGHHGGAWKVAYADFVTAMMAFFLVMWLMGSDEETKAAVSHYFNHPQSPWKDGRDPASDETHPMGEREGSGDSILVGLGGLNPDDLVPSPVRPVNEQLRLNQELSELVREVLEGQAYAVDVNIEHMKFSVPESVLFKPGTNQLTAGAEKYLKRLGQLFNGYKGYVSIEGHTDDPPVNIGRFSNAYEFSLARAVTIMNYMVDHQWISEDRMLPVGSGAKRGLASNDTPENRKKNRRIDFTLSMKREL